MIWLYRFIWLLFFPIITVFMLWRILTGKERIKDFPQRLGISNIRRPKGKLVWIHGASVGEAISILPLIRKLTATDPKLNILVTSGTRTSVKLMRIRLKEISPNGKAFNQLVPLDFFPFVWLFMLHWNPDLTVFIESEFWPEKMVAAKPVLLNARISDRSFSRYKKLKWFFFPFLKNLKDVIAQREEDALRLQELGIKQAIAGGNLKFDAKPLSCDEEEMARVIERVGARPVMVAASTHPGEENIVLKIHNKLLEDIPDLLTVIVPRHPHRGIELEKQLRAPCRSQKIGRTNFTDIYIADTLGEMGIWYRLADVVIIGGSLLPIGGHNPLEPLKLNTVTLTGPHMFNFKDMLPILKKEGILLTSKNFEELTKQAHKYLSDDNEHKKMREKIASVIPNISGTSKKAAELIIKNIENPKKNA